MIQEVFSLIIPILGGLLTLPLRHHQMRLDRQLKRAEDDRQCAEHRLKEARHELDQVQRVQAWLQTRCPITYEMPTHVHRCNEEFGHYGVHTDGSIAWYGGVLFPPPQLKEAA